MIQDTGHTDEGHDFLGKGLGGGQRDQIDTKRISDTRTVTLSLVAHTPIYIALYDSSVSAPLARYSKSTVLSLLNFKHKK
jgi:hypothetical protein